MRSYCAPRATGRPWWKWHLNSDLGSPTEPQPNDQGFDYFYGHNAFQTPTNRNPDNLYRNREKLPEQEGYTAQLYVEEAMNWLEARADDGPFFLMLSMAEPPYADRESSSVQRPLRRAYPGACGAHPLGTRGGTEGAAYPRGPGEYYANISYLDHQLGRLLAYLEKEGYEKARSSCLPAITARSPTIG